MSGTVRWVDVAIVCNPPPFLLGEGGLSHLPKFRKGGLDRISILRGGLLGKRWQLFLGGVKTKIWINNKNFMKKNVFLCHN